MSTVPLRPSVRSTLRAATAADHGRVDAFFRNGVRDARDYRVYLRGLHAALGGVARALEADGLSPAWTGFGQRDRVVWLGDDLAAQDLAPLPPSRAPALDGDAAVAGALYVIEGSALGARLLVEDARALGWSAARGAAFLHRHAGEGAAQRWRAFVAALEAARFDAAQERAMLAAAGAMFAYTEAEFRRARSAEAS